MAETRWLDRVVDLAAGAGSPLEFRLAVLGALRDTVGCDGALFRPGAHWTGSSSTYIDSGTRFTDCYLQEPSRYRQELSVWCERSRGANAFIYEDLYGLAEKQRTLTYNEVLRPARVQSLMGAPLTFRGRTVGLIFLYRRGAGRGFRGDAAAEVTRCLPAIALAEAALQPPAPAEPSRDEPLHAAFRGLSARERQIANLLAHGLASKEIARILGTSFHTVRKQTLRVFDRLGVHDRARLAVALQNARLVD